MEKANPPLTLSMKIHSSVETEIKSSPLTSFLTFVSGVASKRWYLTYFYSVVFFFGMCFTYSIGAFPPPYMIRYHFISTLGVIDCNPDGFRVFNVGLIIVGLLSIPVIVFQYQQDLYSRHINMKHRYMLARYAFLISIASAFGLSLVGIFPAQYKTPHIFGAALVFLGMYIVNNIRFSIYIGSIMSISDRQSRLKRLFRYYTIVVVFNIIGVFFLLSLLLDQKFILINPPYSSFLSCSLWEWIYFLTLVAMFIRWIFPYLDDQSEKKTKRVFAYNSNPLAHYNQSVYLNKNKKDNRAEKQINS